MLVKEATKDLLVKLDQQVLRVTAELWASPDIQVLPVSLEQLDRQAQKGHQEIRELQAKKGHLVQPVTKALPERQVLKVMLEPQANKESLAILERRVYLVKWECKVPQEVLECLEFKELKVCRPSRKCYKRNFYSFHSNFRLTGISWTTGCRRPAWTERTTRSKWRSGATRTARIAREWRCNRTTRSDGVHWQSWTKWNAGILRSKRTERNTRRYRIFGFVWSTRPNGLNRFYRSKRSAGKSGVYWLYWPTWNHGVTRADWPARSSRRFWPSGAKWTNWFVWRYWCNWKFRLALTSDF